MIYTEGNVKTDDLQVGDVIAIGWAKIWGPIVSIYPYGSTNIPFLVGARVARFTNGVECTLEPGGTMFPG